MERVLVASREIAYVARDNSEFVLKRRGSNHAVQQRQLVSLLFQVHHEFSPPSANRGVPWKAINGLHHVAKPMLESCPLTSTRERENVEAQFTQNDGVHDEIFLVRAQPVDDLAAGHRLGRLAEHIRIDQVSHASLGTFMWSVVSLLRFPDQTGHRFRTKPATQSGANRPWFRGKPATLVLSG